MIHSLRSVLSSGLVLLAAAAVAAGSPETVVICAPGFPGTMEQAQPTMDDFARAVERAAGRAAGSVSAVYHPTAAGGLDALADDGAVVALVSLPFYLEHGEDLGLRPLLQPLPVAGADEQWSLVAKAGRVQGPASLDGWTVAGRAGDAPDFLRRVVLRPWGAVPASAEITFAPRVLTVLRAAARGENVAAVLDAAETEALASLPFATDLEIVTRSRPLPASVVCGVGDRLTDDGAQAWSKALGALGETASGRDVLRSMRLEGFRDLPREALAEVEKAYRAP